MKKHNTIICSPIMILMGRDSITYDEAKQRVIECRDALLEANNNLNTDISSDEIIASYLGLEPDYLFDMLDV